MTSDGRWLGGRAASSKASVRGLLAAALALVAAEVTADRCSESAGSVGRGDAVGSPPEVHGRRLGTEARFTGGRELLGCDGRECEHPGLALSAAVVLHFSGGHSHNAAVRRPVGVRIQHSFSCLFMPDALIQ